MTVLEVADLGRQRAVARLETVVLLLLRGDRLLEPPNLAHAVARDPQPVLQRDQRHQQSPRDDTDHHGRGRLAECAAVATVLPRTIMRNRPGAALETPRDRRSSLARRAPPRCGAAGCTSQRDRSDTASPS